MSTITREYARLATYYYLLGVACLGTCVTVGGLAWLALYPAMSCFLVASAYGSRRASFLHKAAGIHSPASILLYGPYLLGVRCTWLYFSARIAPWSEIMPGIVLGRRLRENEMTTLLRSQKVAVLDLAPELPEAARDLIPDYKHVPMLDLVPPSGAQLDEAVAFVHTHYGRRMVFIHCSLGLGRGAAVVAAFLAGLGLDTRKTISLIRRTRGGVALTRATIHALEAHASRTCHAASHGLSPTACPMPTPAQRDGLREFAVPKAVPSFRASTSTLSAD